VTHVRSESSALDRGVGVDAPAVVRLREAAAEWLLSRGIEQWRPGEASEAGGLTAYYRTAGFTKVGRRTFDLPWPPVVLFEKQVR
jgi:hypothetical protein